MVINDITTDYVLISGQFTVLIIECCSPPDDSQLWCFGSDTNLCVHQTLVLNRFYFNKRSCSGIKACSVIKAMFSTHFQEIAQCKEGHCPFFVGYSHCLQLYYLTLYDQFFISDCYMYMLFFIPLFETCISDGKKL